MRVTKDAIYEELNLIRMNCEVVSWAEIVKNINDSGMKVKNWLVVRGVLQYMINNGMFVRTADVFNENYICK